MMRETVEERLKRIEGLLEEQTQQNTSDPDDIFMPRAQTKFDDYRGSLKDFMRERKLRKVVAGRKSLFYNIGATLTGSAGFAELISKAFDAKYNEDEIEDAKRKLEEEFGIKKKEPEKKEESFNKEEMEDLLKKYFDPVNSSVTKLLTAVSKAGQDARSASSNAKLMTDSLIGMIERVSNAVIGGTPKFSSNNLNLKPETIVDAEGKEYLYYPGAPVGRQIYEKSKTGTAGRIASKKIQRKLKEALDIMSMTKPQKKTNLIKAVDDTTGRIVDEIKQILDESTAVRKSQLQELFEKLSNRSNDNAETSVMKTEEDEMRNMLKKTMKDALREFFNENPDLLKADTSIIPLGFPGMIGRLGNFLRRIPWRMLGRTAGVAGVAATVAEVATPAAAEAVQKSTDTRAAAALKKNLEGLDPASLASTISSDQEPNIRAYRLQEYRKIANANPELKTKLSQAEKIAGTVGVSPMDIKNKVKPTTATPDLTVRQAPPGQQIIDENRRRVEINSAQKVEIPSQTVNQINNTQVVPVPTASKIEVNSPDNTFNRLTAQDFDHPYSYANPNMG